MKLFVKLAFLILIGAVAGLFFIKSPDGEPILSATEMAETANAGVKFVQQGWRKTTTAAKRKLGDDNAGKTSVYQWLDESGQWHYSNEAPSDVEAQVIQIDLEEEHIEFVEDEFE